MGRILDVLYKIGLLPSLLAVPQLSLVVVTVSLSAIRHPSSLLTYLSNAVPLSQRSVARAKNDPYQLFRPWISKCLGSKGLLFV